MDKQQTNKLQADNQDPEDPKLLSIQDQDPEDPKLSIPVEKFLVAVKECRAKIIKGHEVLDPEEKSEILQLKDEFFEIVGTKIEPLESERRDHQETQAAETVFEIPQTTNLDELAPVLLKAKEIRQKCGVKSNSFLCTDGWTRDKKVVRFYEWLVVRELASLSDLFEKMQEAPQRIAGDSVGGKSGGGTPGNNEIVNSDGSGLPAPEGHHDPQVGGGIRAAPSSAGRTRDGLIYVIILVLGFFAGRYSSPATVPVSPSTMVTVGDDPVGIAPPTAVDDNELGEPAGVAVTPPEEADASLGIVLADDGVAFVDVGDNYIEKMMKDGGVCMYELTLPFYIGLPIFCVNTIMSCFPGFICHNLVEEKSGGLQVWFENYVD